MVEKTEDQNKIKNYTHKTKISSSAHNNQYHNIKPGYAIILANIGTPKNPGYFSVMSFLRKFLSDSRVIEIPMIIWKPLLWFIILPFRSYSAGSKYEKIYNHKEKKMPLLSISQLLQEKIQKKLIGENINAITYLTMNYSEPSVEKVMSEIKKKSIKKIIVIPLFPQYSASTTASVFDRISKILTTWRYIPEVHFISNFADKESYIKLIANSIKKHWEKNGKGEILLFSFHGLPERNLSLGDPYYCFCQKTTRLIAQELNIEKNSYKCIFQSRFGPAKWLQPYTEDTIVSLAKENIKNLDIIAPGFCIDCLETKDEIAREYAEIFISNGGEKLNYIPCMNASSESVDFFVEWIKKML